MTDFVPNYYYKFNCIAERCRHNCCIGWEILIDDETMGLYKALDTPFGEKIRTNIEGNPPHFILKGDNRCPFLSEDGLCDIISEYGEDAICDICYLHPRFKNFFENFEETGIGLSCEEAARIILLEKEKFSIPLPCDNLMSDNEKDFFNKRQEIIDILQDRSKTVFERFNELSEKYDLKFHFSLKKLAEFYGSLELLDKDWSNELSNITNLNFSGKIFKKEGLQLIFEQLAVYFVFRNMTGALEDEQYSKRVQMVLVSCYLLGAMFEFYGDNLTDEKIIDLARMYSAEIEYAEENLNALIDLEL